MMNDYAWTTLHAHRESEHRVRALRRGADDTVMGGPRSTPARRLTLWLSRHLATVRREPTTVETSPLAPTAAVTAAVTAAAPDMRTARRRTASDAPTAAAAAWARLASGAGSLAPATRPETGSGREAA